MLANITRFHSRILFYQFHVFLLKDCVSFYYYFWIGCIPEIFYLFIFLFVKRLERAKDVAHGISFFQWTRICKIILLHILSGNRKKRMIHLHIWFGFSYIRFSDTFSCDQRIDKRIPLVLFIAINSGKQYRKFGGDLAL